MKPILAFCLVTLQKFVVHVIDLLRWKYRSTVSCIAPVFLPSLIYYHGPGNMSEAMYSTIFKAFLLLKLYSRQFRTRRTRGTNHQGSFVPSHI